MPSFHATTEKPHCQEKRVCVTCTNWHWGPLPWEKLVCGATVDEIGQIYP